MSRKSNKHFDHLPAMLRQYAEERSLDFHHYSPYHMRLMDGGFCVLDIWTTGRYYALTTDYHAMNPDFRTIERGGEKGHIPTQQPELNDWLDKFFFAPFHSS